MEALPSFKSYGSDASGNLRSFYKHRKTVATTEVDTCYNEIVLNVRESYRREYGANKFA